MIRPDFLTPTLFIETSCLPVSHGIAVHPISGTAECYRKMNATCIHVSSAHVFKTFNYTQTAGSIIDSKCQITLIALSLSLISCCFSSSNFCKTSCRCLSAASCCRLLSSVREEMVVLSSAMI